MLPENIKTGRLSMIYKFNVLKTVFLFFLGLLISVTANAEGNKYVAGDATMTLNGTTHEVPVTCNVAASNELAITGPVDAYLHEQTRDTSYISFEGWSSRDFEHVIWVRNGNRVTGNVKTKNTSSSGGASNQTADLIFDIRCADTAIVAEDTKDVEQPQIVKDVGDTAKDQSRSEIINETRKGVSDAFKSIFK